MSIPFNNVRYQPLGSNSNILPGAKLYFYSTGTSTLKNIYSNTGHTTALSNPVIADIDGRFPQIFLQADTAYKIKLTDAKDVLIFEEDPVSAVPLGSIWKPTVAAAVADITLPLGAYIETAEYSTNAGYRSGNTYLVVAGGTGTVDGGEYINLTNGLQLLGLFRNGYNVLQWGALADNSTDNTTIFQAAANKSVGQNIDVTEGIYRINGTLTYPDGAIGPVWSGSGLYTTIVRQISTSSDGLTLSGAVSGMTIRDMTFDCVSNSSGDAVDGTATSNSKPVIDSLYERVRVQGYLRGFVIYGGQNLSFKDILFTGQGAATANGIGLRLGNNASSAVVTGSVNGGRITDYDTCLDINSCTPASIKNLTLGPSTTAALNIDTNSVTTVENTFFAASNAVAISSNGYLLMNNCTFSSTGAQLITTTTERVCRIGAGVPRVRVYRNGNQTIATATYTKVEFNAETEDTEGHWDPTTNYRFVADQPGSYRVDAKCFMSCGADGTEYRISIYVQGASVSEKYYWAGTGFTGNNFAISISDVVFLNANERIEIYVRHNTGGNETVNSSVTASTLTIYQE